MNPEYVKPKDIEHRSFEIIESELPHSVPDDIKPIVLRVIHTTADFDYVDNLVFSDNVLEIAVNAIHSGALFVTDTNMAKAGINKPALNRFCCSAECFMSDEDVAKESLDRGTTRAVVSVEKAAKLNRPVIYAVGNAPTALMKICEMHKYNQFNPVMVIGAPVGFVNVVQSKEMLLASGIPYIAALGRKGGSTVAAAIINALLYMS